MFLYASLVGGLEIRIDFNINKLMRYYHLIFIMVLSFPLIAASRDQESTAHDKWKSFLESPLDSNYQLLIDEMNRCQDVDCKRALGPDYDETGRLVKLIAESDKNAINLAFMIQPNMLPGHPVEEVTRALGSVADADPGLFISLANYYRTSDAELESMINMMPEYVIDDIPAAKRAIQKRMDSLLSIQDPELIDTRDKAVSFLRKYFQVLEKIEE